MLSVDSNTEQFNSQQLRSSSPLTQLTVPSHT